MNKLPAGKQNWLGSRSSSVRARVPFSLDVYYLFAVPSVVLSLLGLFFGGGAVMVGALCVALIVLAVVFVEQERRRFGGVTLTSAFVAIYAFVFGVRGLYIAIRSDFSIINLLGLPSSFDLVSNAMSYVYAGGIAYVAGAHYLAPKLESAKLIQFSGAGDRNSRVNLSIIFLLVQVVLCAVLLPFGFQGYRVGLYELSDSAYYYLLPTLIHGFDLYFFTDIISRWKLSRGPVQFVFVVACIVLILAHAYLLSNMSTFRSFYLAGVFVCLVSSVLVLFGRISTWILVALFLFYPFFKALGGDRSLTNAEMLAEVVLTPKKAYSAQGMEDAFGQSTDINMLDALVASLNWEHSYRGYVFSYIYPLVHWVPRQWWPSKPIRGVLSDADYLYVEQLGRFIPYSPGIIGFFNDDGGKLYMIGFMFLLGVFMRYWEIFVVRRKSYDMQIIAWATLVLSSIVTVRYLPYQIFYQFLAIYGPCLVCDSFVGRRGVSAAHQRSAGRMD